MLKFIEKHKRKTNDNWECFIFKQPEANMKDRYLKDYSAKEYEEEVTLEDDKTYYLMTNLRTRYGVNLDEYKMRNAFELIKNMSDNYQIIYFICHSCRDYDKIDNNKN